MQNPDLLKVAFKMINQFGPNAEMMASDKMDSALQAADAGVYEEWRGIAESIAALTRQSLDAKTGLPATEHNRSAAA